MIQTYSQDELDRHCSATWKLLEIEFHGPYKILKQDDVENTEKKDEESGECLVVTILDTFSKWIQAKAIFFSPSPESDDPLNDINCVAKKASNYIFTTLCHFGLAHFCLSYKNLNGNSWSKFSNMVSKILEEHLEILDDMMTFDVIQTNNRDPNNLNPSTTSLENKKGKSLFDILNLSSIINSSDDGSQKIVANLIARMVEKYKDIPRHKYKHPLQLSTFLDILLFEERISHSDLNLKWSPITSKEPSSFSCMFGKRSPFTKEINCEKSFNNTKMDQSTKSPFSSTHPFNDRRNLKSSILECRHCGDIFTSRVSFKIHQKYHLDKAKQRGVLEGQSFSNQQLTNKTNNADEMEVDEYIVESDEVEHESIRDDPDYSINRKTLDLRQIKKSKHIKNNSSAKQPSNDAKSFIEMIGNNLLDSDVEDLTQIRNHETGEYNAYTENRTSKDANSSDHHYQLNINTQHTNKPLHVDNIVKETAIENVKALLKATKGDRRKRGKYIKYNQNLKHEIALFADKHGASKTAKLYSEKLNFEVSESTVRNFMKAFSNVDKEWNEFKHELSQCTQESGLNESFAEHEKNLENDIETGSEKHDEPKLRLSKETESHLTAISFIEKDETDKANESLVNLSYISHIPESLDGKEKTLNPNYKKVVNDKNSELSSSQRFVCDDYLKLDIGKFAFYHGNPSAISHFSSKLQFQMKESTVRKFKRLWMKKKRISSSKLGSTSQHLQSTKELQFVGSKLQPNVKLSGAKPSLSFGTTSSICSRSHVSETKLMDNSSNLNIKSNRGRDLDLSKRSRLQLPLDSHGFSTGSNDVATSSRSSFPTDTKPYSSSRDGVGIEDNENIPVSLIINDREGT